MSSIYTNKISEFVMQETVYSLCDKIVTGSGDWSEMTTPPRMSMDE
jgi:hypothetical protein